MPTLADVARRLVAAGALARDVPLASHEERLTAEARESGMAVVAGPWGPALSDADASVLFRSLAIEHDRQAQREAAMASPHRLPPTPAQSAMPTPAELFAMPGGDHIAAMLAGPGGPTVTTREHLDRQRAVAQARMVPGVAVQIPEHRPRAPERAAQPIAFPPCPACGVRGMPCSCPGWARPPG